MTCHRFTTPDGKVSGFICTRGPRRRAAPCFYCRAPHVRLCDAEIAPGKTCDRKLCQAHAHSVGPERDLCPDHDTKANRIETHRPDERAVAFRRNTVAVMVALGMPRAAELAEAMGVPMPGQGDVPVPAPLRVFTGNVNRHRSDPDAFDITILSGGIDGRPFAPSMEVFKVAKDARARAEARRLEAEAQRYDSPARMAEFAEDAERIETNAWAVYRRAFLAEMLVSSGREVPAGWGQDVAQALARGVVLRAEAWTKLLLRRRVVLLCYCPGRDRCHRGLVAAILVKMGAVDDGELPLTDKNPDQLSLLPTG